jgi:hypothetical protein
MIKIKVERSPFMRGTGFYVCKKTWNLANDGTWFGPSFVIHIFSRIIRICWVISEELK